MKQQEKFTDQELYALARANSTLASSLLSDQLGFAIPEESFNPPLKITIEEKYIAMNQWILIDILNHLDNRPFILPNNFNDQLKNINTYLDWNGKVFRYSNF